MRAGVLIPEALRRFTGDLSRVITNGATIGEALTDLFASHPDLRSHLLAADGSLLEHLSIYVNDQDSASLDGLETLVSPGSALRIIPSVSGGSQSPPSPLTSDEISRYSRHLTLPEVGVQGQRRLKNASVLLVGAGGLGSPLGLYLAAAGVGRLGLIDFDRVDYSNLQRQIIHGTSDVGRLKLDSARDRLRETNPHVQLDLHHARFSAENALQIASNYDLIIDGTDNFPTRYLVNDVCVLLGKPNVYGSIYRFDGQASVFSAGQGPCYRCLFPEPPPPGLVPNCAEGGVLGVLPGVIGTIQATEALKLLLGQGRPLIGRLLLFDALNMKFREVKLRRVPSCPACGENPTIHGPSDLEASCSAAPSTNPAPSIRQWTPTELAAALQTDDRPTLLDVRSIQEWEIARIPGATLIPLPDLESRLHELDPTDQIVVYCKTGRRSNEAIGLLEQKGFEHSFGLRGGICAWAEEVDPSMPTY